MTDLFEHPDEIPHNVQCIIDDFSEKDQDYHACSDLVSELHTVGYTCDYGLSAEPYDLRKL